MNSLDFRKDALNTRIKGVPGGKHIAWSTKDIQILTDHYMTVPEKVLRAAAATSRKDVAMRTASIVTRDIQAGDLNFLWVISRKVVDLVGDVVDNVNSAMFNKNNPVLGFHDSSTLPVATSSPPYRSGIDLMAVCKFPSPGVNAASDEMAAAVRAGLIKGASIGFRPLRYSFSKDPSRPLGIDFHEVELMEWSLTPSPCCPGCLMVGPVNSKSVDQYAIAARQAEVRSLVSSLEKSPGGASSRPASVTREQRIAEARRLINAMRR
jgi:hypothetical protein